MVTKGATSGLNWLELTPEELLKLMARFQSFLEKEGISWIELPAALETGKKGGAISQKEAEQLETHFNNQIAYSKGRFPNLEVSDLNDLVLVKLPPIGVAQGGWIVGVKKHWPKEAGRQSEGQGRQRH